MSLIRFLEKNSNTRKIFGERELKIIEKQLHGVALTQSEKNRLSRDIRPKFEFIRRAARFEDEFNLKKGAIIKKEIEETKSIILNDKLRKKIQKIVLFGSTADNSRTFRSDIDIAVKFNEITQKQATLFRRRVLGNSPERADVQVYNVLAKKIQREVDLKGRVLYERSKA